jgi:tetratricopeptide (TPR) repeat protein
MGLADDSIKQFLIALQFDPENPGYHYNIANAYTMKGLVQIADKHRRQAANFQGKK